MTNPSHVSHSHVSHSHVSQDPCRDSEPVLADLLNDAVLQSLLTGDHIERAELEAVIRRAQRRLGPPQPAAVPSRECCA